MSVIYSYIGTLLSKWSDWNSLFLTTPVASSVSTINDALRTTGSDNPSRAKEMFRIGLLKEEISTGVFGWNDLHAGNNVQSDLGYVSAAIYDALQLCPGNSVLSRAYASLCAIYSIIQSEKVGSYEISVNTIIQHLLVHFPCPAGQNQMVWIRYLLSAVICEIESGNASTVEKFMDGRISSITLRIIDNTRTRATFANSSQLQAAITSRVSLTGILRQKAALFAIGESSSGDPQGFYGIAYKYCRPILEECYNLEISNVSRTPFSRLYIEDRTGDKGDAINKLKTLAPSNLPYTQKINTVMKNIAQGAKAALAVLAGGPTALSAPNDHQIIYFGAPGTGKSHTLEDDIAGHNFKRVIFHPDVDYASFVGCYKPKMNGVNIEYAFKAQAFIEAYVEAWKDTNVPYYLIIEEINRGDCAQIFGDMFQLLDRTAGISDYAVSPDEDLRDYLKKEFAAVTSITDPKIKSGEEMRLPANLYLRATMNTSDQSLFPMDSAFKRRWSWRYFSIKNESAGFKIVVDDGHVRNEYDWWDFISKINKKIFACTSSEDKQLGYWFAKLPLGTIEISENRFVSKIVFYLWNDVFKDYTKDANNAFGANLTYSSFYDASGNIVYDAIREFMNKNNVTDLLAPASTSSATTSGATAATSTLSPTPAAPTPGGLPTGGVTP